MNQYVNQYKQTNSATASKEQILLMLYDGIIKFLLKAKIAFEKNDIQEIHNNLTKAQRIITELQSSLDMQNGGKFAQDMYNLYEYYDRRLFEANVDKKTEYVDEVLRHITELRDTWKEAIKNFHAQGHTLSEYVEVSEDYNGTEAEI